MLGWLLLQRCNLLTLQHFGPAQPSWLCFPKERIDRLPSAWEPGCHCLPFREQAMGGKEPQVLGRDSRMSHLAGQALLSYISTFFSGLRVMETPFRSLSMLLPNHIQQGILMEPQHPHLYPVQNRVKRHHFSWRQYPSNIVIQERTVMGYCEWVGQCDFPENGLQGNQTRWL